MCAAGGVGQGESEGGWGAGEQGWGSWCCVWGVTGMHPSLSPEPPAVCPSCGSDHVVLLALSAGAPSGEQRPEEQLPASSQSPSAVRGSPGDGDPGARADSPPSQALVSHDRHGWSLSPRECGPDEAGWCLGREGARMGEAGWNWAARAH